MDYETMYLYVSQLLVERTAEVSKLKQEIEDLRNPKPQVVVKGQTVYRDRPVTPPASSTGLLGFTSGLMLGTFID